MFIRTLFIASILVAIAAMSTLAEAKEPVKITIFGDSLTSGYGLDSQEDALPAMLQGELAKNGVETVVTNAGVSGDTTAAALARIQQIIAQKPQMVIIALGGNDALRGVDPEIMRNNLDQIITQLKAANAYILLAGMRSPPSMGLEYTARFNEIFPQLAERHTIISIPFLLEGVAGRPEYNQPDGIHPNIDGVKIMVKNLYPTVERMARRY